MFLTVLYICIQDNFLHLKKRGYSGPGRTRTNGYKLEKFRFKTEIGKNWFTNRVVDEWNRLISHVVSAKSIDCFKNRLDKFMSDDRW